MLDDRDEFGDVEPWLCPVCHWKGDTMELSHWSFKNGIELGNCPVCKGIVIEYPGYKKAMVRMRRKFYRICKSEGIHW